MHNVKWTSKALSDLNRLFDFLAQVIRKAATRTVQPLTKAPQRIIEQPRIGEQLDEFDGREVRRLLIGHYEMRYELTHDKCIYPPRLAYSRIALK
ncbi:type II toxin-antitoxin system RelE/ParE family toxin [Methyloprofundus sp.]|uniref:type II toxin-antitoxin system RelE/ParE family toxin n=1 Tax=Methyloprofundus sp. TaxID=2020875 RepID=UPI003D14F3D1